MGRIILGVIAGYIVWSIVWVGVDAIIRMLWTSYNESVQAMTFSSGMLVVPLFLSIVCSLLAGYTAAALARENAKSTLILGILLLLTGIMVQAGVWNQIPLWYHLTFLVLLIPMTMIGGKLRQT